MQEFYEIEANKCEICGNEYKRAQDLKAHKTRARHHYHPTMTEGRPMMAIVRVMAIMATEAACTRRREGSFLSVRWGSRSLRMKLPRRERRLSIPQQWRPSLPPQVLARARVLCVWRYGILACG